MANLQRIRILWSGFVGAPGYTTFYAVNATAALPALSTLFTGFGPVLPNDVTISFPSSGDIIDPLDGTLVGAWSATAPADIVGSSGGAYAAPTGVMVRWETGSILDGRRLVGRTYMVPAAGATFDTDGSINASDLVALRAAVGYCLAAAGGTLVVWHRPRPASIVHPVARAGGYTSINAGTVPDEAVVLRSRRD